MKKYKFKTDILIRDKRLQWMQNQGLDVSWEYLSDDVFEKHLRNKLIEEATEAANEINSDDFVEELGDVFEVLDYLMRLKGISREDVLKTQTIKAQKFGKFDERIYTHHVQMNEDNPAVQYYLNNAEKYPEIKE